MKTIFSSLLLVLSISSTHALVISEVMSNPIGDDSGREWIEVSNDTEASVDLSGMTISIKGGTAVVVTPLQGGVTLPSHGYAIIASVVSGQTKFLQDYPTYPGLLFKSPLSLVNTGVTSIDIKLNGINIASLPSYTAAKEGSTLSFVGGSYVAGIPTPGADNQVADTSSPDISVTTSSSTATETQATLPQMTPPSSDIVIYLPMEKTVVAGAESEFSVFSQTRAGKPINDLQYTWAFGDGGRGTGSSTRYRYGYSGRYIAQVEAVNPTTIGSGRMIVRVVPPDLSISTIGSGKYGTYVDIKNPNTYDLDLSQWTLTIDGAGFPFPKNTFLPSGATTRFSGLAMGFASTSISTSSVVKMLFPTLEEVTRFAVEDVPLPDHVQGFVLGASTTTLPYKKPTTIVKIKRKTATPSQGATSMGMKVNFVQSVATITPATSPHLKDTRIVSWFRGLFGH